MSKRSAQPEVDTLAQLVFGPPCIVGADRRYRVHQRFCGLQSHGQQVALVQMDMRVNEAGQHGRPVEIELHRIGRRLPLDRCNAALLHQQGYGRAGCLQQRRRNVGTDQPVARRERIGQGTQRLHQISRFISLSCQ